MRNASSQLTVALFTVSEIPRQPVLPADNGTQGERGQATGSAASPPRHSAPPAAPLGPSRPGSRGYHPPMTEPVPAPADTRPYSPGLEGVIAGETSLSYIDGEAGRLLYRGYPIGELVKAGSYAAVAELLWTGDWKPDASSPASRSRTRS